MTSSNIAGTTTTYTYDTLGNLVLERSKNGVVDYQYNELNQLTKKKEGSESYSYTYDKRGNRTAEIGKKASRSYQYDETNRMVEGTNRKGDKSAYTYNGLGLRVNNTHTTHAGKVYARDYVIDYTSFENDDLMVFAEGNGQPEYEQKHVYAGSERTLQFTDKGNWERTLYVHEDVMGNTRYYTKANGQSFAELTYDAWGMPESPNKLLNNDHGNYVFATFTGHIYDTTLDIYFAEARFYDANNRTWLAIDPIKDGGNWYQYCGSNPATYWDPTGLKKTTGTKQALLAGSEIEPALFWRQRDFFQRAWYQDEETFNLAYQMLLKEAGTSNLSVISLAEMYDYFDYFGYANTRLATLQALVGAEVTGVYYGQELSAVGSILISQGVEYNSWNPKLTQSTLKELKDWYDSCNKTVRKLSYELDNGWGDVISGVTYLSVATVANQQAKAPKVSEGGNGTGKIRTQAELDALAADPAHGGKIGAKSIAERDVGLGLESQGKVNSLVRDPSGSAEFIDTITGQKWDVKAFNSQYAPKGYNLTDAMANIKKSLTANENVMLDTRNLTATDLQELTNEISKQGLSDKVLTWP